MAIYVDRVRDYGAREVVKGYVGRARKRARWSHMLADTEEELRAFAVRLGLRLEWIQYPGIPGKVHFDIVPTKRALAIKLGAIEITDEQLLAIRRRSSTVAKGD